MQIVLARPAEPDSAAVFTLQTYGRYADNCPICEQQKPTFFADPTSPAAMDPAASPIYAAEVCTDCLNKMLAEGVVIVASVDPTSF
jgi:hypothetical protein